MGNTQSMRAPLHSVRFPGESAEYRAARDRLLLAEQDLRKHHEQVAVLRRSLPLGGAIPVDYVFEESAADIDDKQTVRSVRMSELFESGSDSLILYNYMYGPEMPNPCPMCTSMLDSLDGAAVHAAQRVNLCVVATSSIARLRKIARERGWRRLRLLSSANTSYSRDYHGENSDGAQLPGFNVFVRRDGMIRHFYMTELLFMPPEPGQDARPIDAMWPLWNLLDLTPEGRGTDWSPQLRY